MKWNIVYTIFKMLVRALYINGGLRPDQAGDLNKQIDDLSEEIAKERRRKWRETVLQQDKH